MMRIDRAQAQALECVRIRTQGISDALELIIDKRRMRERDLATMVRMSNEALHRLCDIAGLDGEEVDEMLEEGDDDDDDDDDDE